MRKINTSPENVMSEGLLKVEESLSRSLAPISSKMVLIPAGGQGGSQFFTTCALL